MISQLKVELTLDGLDCASCADKIETNIKGLAEVENSTMNFISKTLIIEMGDSDKKEHIVRQVKDIIGRYEPHVIVKEKGNGSVNGHGDLSNKKELIRIGVGAIFFAVTMVSNFSFWLEFFLYLISYFMVGGKVVLTAVGNIRKGQVFDENFLMSIATLGAFAIKEFPEAVAVMLFYQIGEFFQDLAVNRSRRSISELMDIRPDYANLVIGNDIARVSPEQVKVGDRIIIKPGERVPLDGRVIEGKSMLDTTALTGESVPREVKPEDMVLSGCINLNGVLTLKVEKAFGESTVAKILDLVQNAGSKKAKTEHFITSFARYYTPVVVFTAIAIAFIPPLILGSHVLSEWLYRGLIFLVISCPCALVVSIPLGFFGGIGGASKNGILIKGGNYLEALKNVDTIVFDKTGTLTKGVFKVTDIVTHGGLSREQLLKIAAHVESYSNHPIGTSIVKAYGKGIDEELIGDYEEIFGLGIRAKYEGKEIIIGNNKLMEQEKINYFTPGRIGTIVHVAAEKEYGGYILISDEIKEDAKKTIRQLKNLGVKKTVMLTGDSYVVGKAVAEELGIDEYYTELLPHNKVEMIELVEKQKITEGKVVFVGDGINDAPVLARADIGIAMGGLGSDAAIEAADVVLMTDEPSKLITAIKIAKRTNRIVWQNIIFALGIKAVVLLLGAGGIATMWEAVFADVGVALLAVLNAMRVLKSKNDTF